MLLQIGTVKTHADDIHIVRAPVGGDVKGDKIDARLETAIVNSDFRSVPNAVMQGRSAIASIKGINADSTAVDLIVCFDHAPTQTDLSELKAFGFTVQDVYSHVIYGVHVIGSLPNGINSLHNLVAGMNGVTFVSPNNVVYETLIHSTRQIGARQSWTTYENYNYGLPMRGDPGRSIAIIDSGMDSSHPDLNTLDPNYAKGNKVVGWFDSASRSPSPYDPVGHGSHVSGIAAGTGVAGGLATGTGFIQMTMPIGNTDDIPVNATGFTTAPQLSFQGFVASDILANGVTNSFLLADFSDPITFTGAIPAANVLDTLLLPSQVQNADSSFTVPLTTTLPTAKGASTTTNVPTNFHYYMGFNSTSTTGDTLDGIATIQTPQTATGDGYNLVTGVAPDSSLVGVRVGGGASSITDATVTGAADFLSANQARYNIGVANLSLGNIVVDPVQDQAIDNLVAQGIVCVIAAGNDRPVLEVDGTTKYSGGIGSPGSASSAITVAALGPQNEVANYSSYGSTTAQTYFGSTIPAQTKPDVSAPGGSSTFGTLLTALPYGVASHDESILSVDSNYSDTYSSTAVSTDLQANDYTGDQGTSMASPHVAGAVALLEQAMSMPSALEGSPKSGADEAYFMKALLEMTSNVTNQLADSAFQPGVPPPNPNAMPPVLPPAPQPALTHLGRDLVEGYGKINVDAGISAILQSYILGDTATATFGPGPMDKQCWARNVHLTANIPYTFTLTQPAAVNGVTPEYDLCLFSEGYAPPGSVSDGNTGDPSLVASSVLTTGAAQVLTYTPPASGIYFIVVKKVVGSGQFSLVSTGGTSATINVTVTDATNSNAIPNAVVLAEAPSTAVVNSGTTGTTGSGLGVAAIHVTAGSLGRVVVSASGYYTASVSVGAGATAASVSLTPAKVFSDGLQMITMPSSVSTPINGSTFPLIFVDAVWTPGNQEYNLPPTSIATNFVAGQGYWVRLRQPTTLQVAPTPLSSGSFTIDLQQGWNMIGSPYQNPGSLAAATVTIGSTPEPFATAFSANQVSGLFSYNSSTGAYNEAISTGNLTAYTGYWIFAAQNCTLTLTGS